MDPTRQMLNDVTSNLYIRFRDMKLEKFPDQFFPEKLLETWRFLSRNRSSVSSNFVKRRQTLHLHLL